METSLPVRAGDTSTVMFLLGALPMLHKAIRTRDLSPCSFGYLLMMNAGNLIHAIYVFSLPPGPIWALHTFWLVCTGLMLGWYLRFEWLPGRSPRSALPGVTNRPVAA